MSYAYRSNRSKPQAWGASMSQHVGAGKVWRACSFQILRLCCEMSINQDSPSHSFVSI